jgi:hypothetical protein
MEILSFTSNLSFLFVYSNYDLFKQYLFKIGQNINFPFATNIPFLKILDEKILNVNTTKK